MRRIESHPTGEKVVMIKVAIIHDWLFGMRGGEYCLKVICELFPDADIYTLFYREAGIEKAISKHKIFKSNFSSLPGVEKYYRYLLPCYSLAVRDLNEKLEAQHQISKYDLVISISHCVAKNVSVPKDAFHLCYCLTPARYLWDQYDSYFQNHPLEPLIRRVFRPLRKWDASSASGVDKFVGISDYISQRINRYYQRTAEVIYPPVNTDWISSSPVMERGDRFLSVSALVPYKSVDLMIESFNELPWGLDIVGRGPEEARLRKLVKGTNIRFLGTVYQSQLTKLYKSSKALIFSAEEDFGRAPVEMQTAGGRVVALGTGEV